VITYLRRGLGLTLIALCCFGSITTAQDSVPSSHRVFAYFGSWKDIPTQGERAFLYTGFVNGFFAGERSRNYDALARCIEKNMSVDQAVAMIDKYSADNPQRWNVPLPMGIAESLTVKDGPCPGLNPLN